MWQTRAKCKRESEELEEKEEAREVELEEAQ